jgi:hypothetical protein
LISQLHPRLGHAHQHGSVAMIERASRQ